MALYLYVEVQIWLKVFQMKSIKLLKNDKKYPLKHVKYLTNCLKIK